MAKVDGIVVKGRIVEQYVGEKFLVKLDNDIEVKAYLGGKLRKNFIRIVPDDVVDVELCPYDLTMGKIIFRHRT